jgi:PAT family beta-lactamase induction signal transducer AmpG
MTEAVAEAPAAPPRDNRAIWVMTALGFAAGLPNALIIGSLSAWLSNADVDLTTIGIISWVALSYAFKFLWAPLLDWGGPPFLKTVGRRRAWLLLTQGVITACLFGLAGLDPRTDIGTFAALAALAAFFSATQDIVIDAWRIEVASDRAPLDILSTRYQLGYRISAFAGGAVALLLADVWMTADDKAAGWPAVFVAMAVLMGCTLIASLMAPEPLLRPRDPIVRERGDVAPARRRAMVLAPVLLGWAWAAYSIIGFMFASLNTEPPPSVAEFQNAKVPLILFATTGFPLLIAFWVSRNPERFAGESAGGYYHVTDLLYSRVLGPLVDVAGRFWLWAVPILGLVMTYRIADSIWGSFANPFYLNILGHSNADVALSSKIVGVFATIFGIALGGWCLLKLGRMTSLVLGAVIAALTNLIYADLAIGGPVMAGFLKFTGLGAFFEFLTSGVVGLVKATGATFLDGVVTGPALAQLCAAIFAENIAGGFAGAVYVAWLSSIVNKSYAAVQYALLSSLTLLIGVIFRPRIGDYIDTHGAAGLAAKAHAFYDVFVFATWIGGIAVVLCCVEWLRQKRGPTDQTAVSASA